MTASVLPEIARLAALTSLCVLDTDPEARFDQFTRLASMTFNVPIALVSLVDQERQWFKSRCGLDARETPRSIAFCTHAVAARSLLVVEDACLDPRFADNPMVTGEPGIRFYAGQPVFSDGYAVGTLCIIDRQPRTLSDAQRQCLRDLAGLVEIELNHARVSAARLCAEQALKAINSTLEQRVQQRTAELAHRLAELTSEIDRRKALERCLLESEAWNRNIIASSYNGFIASGSDRCAIEWNDSAERIFGWTREQVMGQRLSALLIPPELRADHDERMQRLLDAGIDQIVDRKLEMPALTASGRRITVEMTISSYEWKGERCLGAFVSDVTERIRTQQQLDEKQELLDAVLESIDVGVVACDAMGKLTMFNRAARNLHGLDPLNIAPEEWPNHYSLFHADGHTPMALEDIPLIRAFQGEVVRDQAMVIAPAGQPMLTLIASGRPLRNASGRSLGAVVAMKNITELNVSRQRLASSERELRTITENLPALIGKVNAAGEFVFLNSRALSFYNKAAHALIGQPVAAAYSATDFARIAPHVRTAMRGERTSFEELTMVRGQPLHYQCVFVPQRAADGQPDGFFAMAFDISARKLGELQQAENDERLRTITDNVPVLIAQFDSQRRYTFANAVHQSWLGARADSLLGKTIDEAFGTAYLAVQANAFEQAWQGQVSQCEHDIVRKGRTRIAHSTFIPQTRDGLVCGVYVLTTDATVSRHHERSLHALAHTDALTQLPNRLQFEQAIEIAARRTRRGDCQCALLYLDVDHFKQINDRHGHGAGDAVLIEFARRLRGAVRSTDVVARLAGDEFTVLLNDVRSLDDVENVIGKILSDIRAPFLLGFGELQVSVTIGAAVSGRLAIEPKALIELADQALYSAKEAGRNTFAIRYLEEVHC